MKIIDVRFNSTNPDAVIKTHLDFLEAGAEAIITNTYQASVEGYNKYLNFDNEKSIKLIKDTVKLAHVARSMYLQRGDVGTQINSIPWIVGSIVSFRQIKIIRRNVKTVETGPVWCTSARW